MDLEPVLSVYGPLGVGVLALGYAIVKLHAMFIAVSNARLSDTREHYKERLEDAIRHQEQTAENIKTLQKALDVLEATRNG